jgi:hypothetical protein
VVDNMEILEYPSHNPQDNFSPTDTRKTPETKFAEQFSRVYRDKFTKIHSGTNKSRTLFVREVPVFGNGIPDLLVLSWSDGQDGQASTLLELENLTPTVRAFEFKLSHWRKGLMQAHRYKNFSHASILVLPSQKIKLVEQRIDLFRKLRIGLWGFSPETGHIGCFYTPRPIKQQIPKYERKIVRLAAQLDQSQFGPLLKLPQTIQ